MQVDSTGDNVLSAFGFGSTTGPDESSNSVIYLKNEFAVILFKVSAFSTTFVGKIHLASSSMSWSKKVSDGSDCRNC